MREARFGPYRLDLTRRELWHGDRPIPLGARAVDILCLLVSARGDVVSKDELMAKIWPGIVVEENNIQVHVSALRKAIAATTDGQAFLMTVPGRGYRFIGLELADEARSTLLPDQPEHPPLPDKPSIAVLPFVNLGGDAEQEYFADGIAEDIITALARFRWFFVIPACIAAFLRSGPD
jgi:DNA-binding winged helix-turn-helix (wHTH) protein